MTSNNNNSPLRYKAMYGYLRDGLITVVALALLVIESLGTPNTEVLLAIMALLGVAPALRIGTEVKKRLNGGPQ